MATKNVDLKLSATSSNTKPSADSGDSGESTERLSTLDDPENRKRKRFIKLAREQKNKF